MRRVRASCFNRYSVVTLGAAVAAMSFATTLQLSAVPRGAEPAKIDRTLKGDRLPPVPGARGAEHNPALPEGCLTQADGHRDIFATEVPGRCLA